MVMRRTEDRKSTGSIFGRVYIFNIFFLFRLARTTFLRLGVLILTAPNPSFMGINIFESELLTYLPGYLLIFSVPLPNISATAVSSDPTFFVLNWHLVRNKITHIG